MQLFESKRYLINNFLYYGRKFGLTHQFIAIISFLPNTQGIVSRPI